MGQGQLHTSQHSLRVQPQVGHQRVQRARGAVCLEKGQNPVGSICILSMYEERLLRTFLDGSELAHTSSLQSLLLEATCVLQRAPLSRL